MDELVGVWSSEWSGLYYSAFEDESLAFGADGSGWYQFSRPSYAEISYFTWRRTAPGQIELSYNKRRVVKDGVMTDRQPDTTPARFAYQAHEEDTPLGGMRLILRIDPAISFAREFGLRSRDPAAVAPDEPDSDDLVR